MRLARAILLAAAAGLAACAVAPESPGAAAAPLTAAALTGTRWVAVLAGDADPRHAPRLEFVREGRVSGFTGCNMLTGSWRIEEGRAKLGPVATTKRFCVGPEMDLEKRVLAAMGDGATIAREGDRLVVRSPDGKARMEYQPAP